MEVVVGQFIYLKISKKPAHNERFGVSGGGKVIAQTLVCPLTVGDSPNGMWLDLRLRKAAGTLYTI